MLFLPLQEKNLILNYNSFIYWFANYYLVQRTIWNSKILQ